MNIYIYICLLYFLLYFCYILQGFRWVRGPLPFWAVILVTIVAYPGRHRAFRLSWPSSWPSCQKVTNVIRETTYSNKKFDIIDPNKSTLLYLFLTCLFIN